MEKTQVKTLSRNVLLTTYPGLSMLRVPNTKAQAVNKGFPCYGWNKEKSRISLLGAGKMSGQKPVSASEREARSWQRAGKQPRVC